MVWFIGDLFTTRSFKQYFKDRDHLKYGGGYTKDHFEVSAFLSDKFMSNNQNMLS